MAGIHALGSVWFWNHLAQTTTCTPMTALSEQRLAMDGVCSLPGILSMDHALSRKKKCLPSEDLCNTEWSALVSTIYKRCLWLFFITSLSRCPYATDCMEQKCS